MMRLGWLGVVLVALGCTEGAPPSSLEDPGAAQATAKLTHVSGKVLVKRSNGDDWIDAVEAMDLRENDKVRTQAGGSATIEYAGGGTAQLGEDGLFAIAETRTRPGSERTDLTVIRGHVEAELKDARHQTITVTTPSATVRAGRDLVFQ
ncbi:MAG TPA: FecR domain-containing protein [Myxococcales bacterium]|nr:FecR domain-containing protein [Myxococcales bacterium]